MAGAPVQVECQMGECILACAHPIMQLLDVNIAKLWCEQRSGWSPSWWSPDDGLVFERANVPNLGERSDHAMLREPGREVVVDRGLELRAHRREKASLASRVGGTGFKFEVLRQVTGTGSGES